MRPALITILLCLAACTTSTGGPTDQEDSVIPEFLESIELIPDALGDYNWTLSTANPESQAFFNQGMQLRWAYNMNEATRSMVTARLVDPKCAMCFWGEAFTLGSFLNGPMTPQKAIYAHTAIVKAGDLAPRYANKMEQELIAAAQVRYPAKFDPDNRSVVDQAFADEMRAVYEHYPQDHNVAVVYAVALFMLEQRRGYRDVADPDLIRLHKVLTGVLDQDIRHPGACHLYIHATESSQHPEWGLPCAEYLGQTIKIASHIQHMPSHTWNEVGQWGRSVKANIAAWHSDQKASEDLGFSYGASHNLHMLLFAASYDGQGAPATQAGKDFRKVTGNSMYEVLTLLRFGRFDEILANDDRPKGEATGAMWDFAQGYASLKQGDLKTAIPFRDKVLKTAQTTTARFRFHPAEQVIGTVAHILEGEILAVQGDLPGAIAAFNKAIEQEDLMDYDEPEPLPFAARHWLGAALLQAGQYADAEQVYRDELSDHPHNGWSLYGLRQALSFQGRTDDAVDADFAQSWARSDVWITASRI